MGKIAGGLSPQASRRYVQSEHVFGRHIYRQYFGPVLFSGFREAKAILDPRALFNRGSVFSF